MKKICLLLITSLIALPLPVMASVFVDQLENGLKVIVKEDHRAPIVVSQIWYKVGSSYEYGGITGVSHVLEHMMFKGTKKVPAGEFSRIIAENGGKENAFTGRDYTAYFQQLEKSRLEVSFELEADRMRHLLLPDDEFQKERNVVIEERRLRTEDKPESLTYEQFLATAWQASPYQNPIIGWMEDLKSLTKEDLQSWYQQWYAPNNATLVIAGDVKAEEVFVLAKKYFATIKPSTIVDAKPRTEPKQLGIRRMVVNAPAKLPSLYMGYKVPVLRTSDEPWKAYALEMLANVLDGGDSARLTRELIRGQQLAASIGAGYDLIARHDSLFIFEGTPIDGVSLQQLELAINKQIQRLQTELVSESELTRIKAQVTAAKVFELDSVFYQAMKIGQLETVGLNHQTLDHYADEIARITPEQIREVAKTYLSDKGLTVAWLIPEKQTQEKPDAH
jgi:zinc protease